MGQAVFPEPSSSPILNWTLIESKSATTLTTFSSLGSYKKIMATFNAVGSGNQDAFLMYFNTDTGRNYGSGAEGNTSGTVRARSVNQYAIQMSAESDNQYTGYVIIDNVTSTTMPKTTESYLSSRDSAYNHFGKGIWTSTAAITSINFKTSFYAVDSGTIKLYGAN